MISLSKLITLALIVLAVWYGFKWLNKFNAARQERAERHARREAAEANPPVPTEDMTKCAVCGVYVPARGAPPCPRPDCPLRR